MTQAATHAAPQAASASSHSGLMGTLKHARYIIGENRSRASPSACSC